MPQIRNGSVVSKFKRVEAGLRNIMRNFGELTRVIDSYREAKRGPHETEVLLAIREECADLHRKVADVLGQLYEAVDGPSGTRVRQSEVRIVQGVISSKACERCGHHETGLTTDQGDFIPIRPGQEAAVSVP